MGRRAVTLVLVALSVLSVLGGGCGKQSQLDDRPIPWRRDVDKAREESAATGKPAILFFHADYCPRHNDVLVRSFSDPAVGEIVANDFIPVAVNATDEDEPRVRALLTELRVLGIPALFVVGPGFTDTRLVLHDPVQPSFLVRALRATETSRPGR